MKTGFKSNTLCNREEKWNFQNWPHKVLWFGTNILINWLMSTMIASDTEKQMDTTAVSEYQANNLFKALKWVTSVCLTDWQRRQCIKPSIRGSGHYPTLIKICAVQSMPNCCLCLLSCNMEADLNGHTWCPTRSLTGHGINCHCWVAPLSKTSALIWGPIQVPIMLFIWSLNTFKLC